MVMHILVMYFFRENGECGFYDYQVVSGDQSMRDVSYHLIMSCSPDLLEKEEKNFVLSYIRKLEIEQKKKLELSQNHFHLTKFGFNTESMLFMPLLLLLSVPELEIMCHYQNSSQCVQGKLLRHMID